MAPSKVLASQRRRAKPRPNGRGPGRVSKKETTTRTKRKTGRGARGTGAAEAGRRGTNFDCNCIQIAISTQNVGMRTQVGTVWPSRPYHSANDTVLGNAKTSQEYHFSQRSFCKLTYRRRRQRWEISRDASAAPREAEKAQQRRNRRPQMQTDTYLAMAVKRVYLAVDGL